MSAPVPGNNHDQEDRLNARALAWRRIAGGLLVLLLTAAAVSSAYNAFQIRQTQKEGSPTQQRLIGIAEQIRSCTTPEGECSKRSQEQAAAFLAGIDQSTRLVVVAALSCQADGITEREALARCTIERSKP